MQGLDSVSKIMKKIIPNFRKKRCIFPNLPGFGCIPKTMRKNAANSTAVPGLINRNLLTERVLDIVLSFNQSNVPIVTDYGFCKSMADERQKVKRHYSFNFQS